MNSKMKRGSYMLTARSVAIAFLLSLLLAFQSVASDKLVTVDSNSWKEARDAVRAIEAYGGKVKIVVLPHFIMADIPDAVETDLIKVSQISGIHAGDLEPADFEAYGRQGPHVVTAWNSVFRGKAQEMGLADPPAPDRLPLINDVDNMGESRSPLKPPGAGYYDTSEFLLGTVVLGVILPESDGSIDASTEDWTPGEQSNVTSEIIAGLNWYVTTGKWRPLTFYTFFHYSVPTGYEPISRSSSDEYLWGKQCMNQLGYTCANYPICIYPYLHDIRDSLDADWAVACLVVDSSNDADNMFSNGRFAYSSLGGPRFVMTYGNDGWGISNMDAVCAHELGHSFYALDEYEEAEVGCTVTCGYLNAENQNSEYPYGPGGCATNVYNCIMRSVTLSAAKVCYYSKGQIGWWDSDVDSIADILDTYPETVLFEYLPDPCSTFTPTYAGSSWATKLPNQNPLGAGIDITLNRVAKVEYRVDDGDWHDATPNDGTWDQFREGYHFTTDPLSADTHVIESRALHTYGNYDTSYAVDTLTVVTSGIETQVTLAAVFIETHPNPFGPRVEVRYSVPGEYGSAVPVSMRIYDVRGRTVTDLMEGTRSPGPGYLAWDGTYSNGDLAPSGIYFIDLVAGKTRVVRKLVLAR
jgi:hypothetical protein